MTSTRSAPPDVVSADAVRHENRVQLRGRLSGVDDPRTLPSGDELVGFRLVVERPPRAREGGRAAVDTIDCQAVRAPLRRALARLQPGQLVEVEGSLRRRFWHGAGGLASRYAVEVDAVRRPSARA